MNQLNDVVTRLLALRGKKAELSTELKRLNKEEGTLLDSLKKRIEDGESTGNHITDFVVVCCHEIPGSEMEKPYRELEARLKGRIGELVLVIHSRTEPDRDFVQSRGPIPRFQTNHLQRTFWMGVLTGDTLVFENNAMRSYLPTHAGYAICPKMDDEHVESGSGNIPLDNLLHQTSVPLHLDKPLNTSHIYPPLRAGKTINALEVVVGADAVANWFEGNGELFMEGFDNEGLRALLVFREAARRIGRTAPESPLLGEEIRRRTEAMMQHIGELDKKYHTCKWDLETAARSNESNRRTQQDAAREALKSAEAALKDALSNAIEEGFVNKTYDPNETIRNLCIEHDIALPNEV